MSEVTYHVGLDYHQHSVQVCVLDQQGNMIQNATRPNDWQAVGWPDSVNGWFCVPWKTRRRMAFGATFRAKLRSTGATS